MQTDSEAQLVELLKLGDAQAVKYWFTQYHLKMLRFVQSKISQPQDAEELTQQTFLNCLKNLPLFLGTSSLWTWMISIAKHEVSDYFRKKYAKRAIQTLPLSQLLLATQIDDSHEISQKVMHALHRMDKYSGELLLKKYVDGMRVAQIAQEVGKTVKAVESELFRARHEFKVLYLAMDEL